MGGGGGVPLTCFFIINLVVPLFQKGCPSIASTDRKLISDELVSIPRFGRNLKFVTIIRDLARTCLVSLLDRQFPKNSDLDRQKFL